MCVSRTGEAWDDCAIAIAVIPIRSASRFSFKVESEHVSDERVKNEVKYRDDSIRRGKLS